MSLYSPPMSLYSPQRRARALPWHHHSGTAVRRLRGTADRPRVVGRSPMSIRGLDPLLTASRERYRSRATPARSDRPPGRRAPAGSGRGGRVRRPADRPGPDRESRGGASNRFQTPSPRPLFLASVPFPRRTRWYDASISWPAAPRPTTGQGTPGFLAQSAGEVGIGPLLPRTIDPTP